MVTGQWHTMPQYKIVWCVPQGQVHKASHFSIQDSLMTEVQSAAAVGHGHAHSRPQGPLLRSHILRQRLRQRLQHLQHTLRCTAAAAAGVGTPTGPLPAGLLQLLLGTCSLALAAAAALAVVDLRQHQHPIYWAG